MPLLYAITIGFVNSRKMKPQARYAEISRYSKRIQEISGYILIFFKKRLDKYPSSGYNMKRCVRDKELCVPEKN